MVSLKNHRIYNVFAFRFEKVHGKIGLVPGSYLHNPAQIGKRVKLRTVKIADDSIMQIKDQF